MSDTKRSYTAVWPLKAFDPAAAPGRRPTASIGKAPGCPAARGATPLLLALLVTPSVVAFVVRHVPETERYFYVSRCLQQLEPLTFEVVSGRHTAGGAGDAALALAFVAAVGLHLVVRLVGRGRRTVLTGLAAVVAASITVVIVDRAGPAPDDHLAGVVLAILAVWTALCIAVAGIRTADPPWARRGRLQWRAWLIGYIALVLPALAVGRAIDAPDLGTRQALNLVLDRDTPAWVAQWMNGIWIGVAAWALAQFALTPRWNRWILAALVLALALGPLRDAALVTPVLPSGWRGWE